MKRSHSHLPNLLLTGGTGFLGSYVLPLLREHFNVYVLSRSGNTEIFGDLRKWDGNIQYEILKDIEMHVMIHLGGLYDLRASDIECMQTNIMGTSMALKICEKLKIPIFLNASSVAAAINSPRKKVFPYDLNFQKDFPDAYSHSKAHAEQMLMNWQGSVHTKINLRLGVLVGNSLDGTISRIDGPYHLPKLLKQLRKHIEILPTPVLLPGDEQKRLPLVPVDIAARAIHEIAVKATAQFFEKGYYSFHLTPAKGIKIGDLYRKTLDYLSIPHRGIILVDSLPSTLLGQISELLFHFPKEEINYLLNFPIYDSTNTQELLGKCWCPEFEEYESTFWRGYEKIMANR